MATEAIQKQPQREEQVETWRLSYEAAWEQAFNEFMFLMAEQYSLELMIEAGNRQIPSPMVAFWRESLKDLSPLQMREGLRRYMLSDRRSFKPTPGDITENTSPATDKPRKVYDPKCIDCNGTGFRIVLTDSKIHVGKKAQWVTHCYCTRIVYGGQEFEVAKQLPPAPDNAEAAEIVGKLAEKLPALKQAVKTMPAARPEQSEADYSRRQKELEDQRKKLGVKNS